jgi:hypothetical protein
MFELYCLLSVIPWFVNLISEFRFIYPYYQILKQKMATTLTHQQSKEGLNEFTSNYHTGIDLIHHPPNETMITDQSLLEFAGQLEMTSTEINKIKQVSEKVLAQTLQQIPNVNQVEKVIMSECHLCNCGRNDCGLDIVILMKVGEDVAQTTQLLNEKIHALTSAAAGRVGSGAETSGSSQAGKPLHAQMLHFEHEDVRFNVAVGTRHGMTEEANRMAIWEKIDRLDKEGKLKKVHLDQFAIDLYESTTLFMNNQVAPEMVGSLTGSEKFLQGALRLARAWRQCFMSSRDVQFSPLDAWLIMLKAVQKEVDKAGQAGQKPQSGFMNIGKRLKEVLKGSIEAPQGVSMKNVMRTFLNDLSNLEQMNIMFNNFYDVTKVPHWIKDQRPLVLDPVCPYRNTVYNLHKRTNDDIKKHAMDCIRILDDPNSTLPKLFHLPSYKKRGA